MILYNFLTIMNLSIFVQDNKCADSPCLNNGNCTQTPTGFNCTCPQFYGGPTCQNCDNIKKNEMIIIFNKKTNIKLKSPTLAHQIHV